MKSSLPGWLVLCLCLSPVASGEDWVRFRGNDGQGVAESAVPLKWDQESGVAWKTELPGEGSSSPIIVGGRVLVTCYRGESGADAARILMCVDAESGRILWQHTVNAPAAEDEYSGFLQEHGYASGTPVSDGEHVYAFFGKGGVVCCTLDGQRVWQQDVGQGSSNRRWGSGASPVLAGDILIVNASEESLAIVGLDKRTGEEKWRADYDGLELCYATPVIVAGEDGETEAVLSMPGEIWGLNPETGKLRWFCEIGAGGNVSPSVVVSDSAYYTFGGFPQQQTNAVRRGGRGDVTQTHHLWASRDSSYVPTPVFLGGYLYWVTDRGQAFAMNAETGETTTRVRLDGLAAGGRAFYASPVIVGDRLVVVSRRSGTFVFEATPEMKQVGVNPPLDETDFNATPAVSEGRLYLRSNKALYCISE